MTHVIVKKLQASDWSTEEAGSEAPSKICVGVSNASKTEHRSTTAREVHDVEMDGLLNQPDNQYSAIGNFFVSITRSIAPTMLSRLWQRC